MSSHTKRTYNAKERQVQAAQTRACILATAKRLLQSNGFEDVTIDQLAKSSGVSASTIYALFQSKRGILRAIMDEALPADQFEALAKQAAQEKSAKAHLVISAKIARHLYDAERAQIDIFRGASLLAPEFKEIEQEREQRRYTRQEKSIKTIIVDKSLAKHLSMSKARDILWAFTGRDMYRLLVVERGWTPEEYEEWLAQWLVKALMENNNG